MKIELIQGNCLTESDKIKDGSVDLILTDLPYGTMKGINETFNGYGRRDHDGHLWDNVIPVENIMNIADRILRKNGKMILFSQEPYTTQLINEAIPNVPFNYRAIWEKDNFAVALGVNKNMVGFYEDVLVFSKNECYEAKHPLRKIMFKYAEKYGKDYLIDLLRKEGRYTSDLSAKVHTDYKFGTGNGKRFDFIGKTMYEYLSNYIDFEETFEELKQIDNEYKIKYGSTFNLWECNKYKSNILKYKKDYDGYHPTQKPILLLEDLIKTFSNENDLVVDLTMGSCSTGIACMNTNRNFIGIELDDNYFNISKKRVEEKRKEKELQAGTLFVNEM